MTAWPTIETGWSKLLEPAVLQHAAPELRAELLSLGGLDARDFGAAEADILRAKRLEPFNPLHDLRHALLCARFGDLASASARLDALKDKIPDAPILDYLRALMALRSGRPEQARSLSAALEAARPEFIPVKFLRAEVSILLANKAQTVERALASLPTGPEWEAAWADLLVKLVLLRPRDGAPLANRWLGKKVISGGPAQTFVQKALGWAKAAPSELGQQLGAESPGSIGEALLLETLAEKLGEEPGDRALAIASELCALHPDRPAARRVWNALLARRAVEASAAENHEEALRLVGMCLYEQPHDAIHHQNRAALFTLLREAGAYHQAWADLNAHQYRLALLGSFDQAAIGQILRTHRLFAQQARGGAATADAAAPTIFKTLPGLNSERNRLIVASEEIAADPDLLRQWIHHGSAELLFRHAALSQDPWRMLLCPEDRDEALARAQGLTSLSRSLATLTPGEGEALAARLSQRFEAAASTVRTRYLADGADAPNAEVLRLRQDHIHAIADLCLLCLQWRPDAAHLWIAEELLAFAEAELPFFDEAVLRDMQSALGYETPFPLLALADQSRVPEGQTRTPFGSFKAELLGEMATSAYNAWQGAAKDGAAQAMTYIERARAEDPVNAEVELKAATLLALGGYLDDARLALDQFKRLVKPENQRALDQSRRIEELLADKRKETPKAERFKRDENASAAPQRADATIEERLKELDRAPGSYRLYEDLVRALAVAGRFAEAVQWADRSIAQCLNRADQMNARGLAVEARALEALAETNPQAARVYAAGAHDPARKAIEGLAQAQAGQAPYPLMYLLGRCQLAAGFPAEARESFERAAQTCEAPLHRTVLRHFADDIDNAYLGVAKAAVNKSLQNGAVAEALQEAAAVFARLGDPAAWLIELAQAHYGAAVATLANPAPAPTLRVVVKTEWRPELEAALAESNLASRALALAGLAGRIHPASARAAQTLSGRVRSLQRQIAAVETLKQAGELLRAQRFAEVISFLDGLGAEQEAEPRLLRIRALALLRLERFNEADDAVELIGEGGPEEVRAFAAEYPKIAFGQRMAAIRRLLKNAGLTEARKLLAQAAPVSGTDAADLAYCQAFASALEGYSLRKEGRKSEARARFLAALEQIEPHLNHPSWDAGPAAQLYDRLEKEISDHDHR